MIKHVLPGYVSLKAIAYSPTSGQESEDGSDASDAQAELRDEIARWMKSETLYCTDEHFLVHYLPPIPETVDVEEVVTDLLEAGYLEEVHEHGETYLALAAFAIKPSEVKADPFFSHLVDVATAIREAIGPSRNSFQLRMDPGAQIKSSRHRTTFGVDACMTASAEASATLRSTDIVVPFGFTIHRDHQTKQEVGDNVLLVKARELTTLNSQNRRRVVSAAVQIMNDDARRNFVYAVT